MEHGSYKRLAFGRVDTLGLRFFASCFALAIAMIVAIAASAVSPLSNRLSSSINSILMTAVISASRRSFTIRLNNAALLNPWV